MTRKDKFHIIIIGAGPAGLRCAKILAENGKNVILFERKNKFDRKICTGIWGMTEKTKHINLPESLLERTFNQVTFRTPWKSIRISQPHPFVGTLNRQKLSEWMYGQAQQAGAHIELGANVSEIGKDYVVVNGIKVSFDFLVGADGSASLVRRSLGIKQHAGEAIQYWINKDSPDMVVYFDPDSLGPWPGWIAPHRGIYSIGTGCDPKISPISEMRKHLDAWCKKDGHDTANALFEGAALCHDYRGYKFDNIFLAGDAAGLVSGLTGEGIYPAIASGEDVARIIINPNHRPILLEKILAIKRTQERIASIFRMHKIVQKICLRIIFFLFRFDWYVRRSIDLIV